MRRGLERFRRGLVRIELVLAGLSLLLLLLLSLAQIVARNFFDTGASAADELQRHLVIYVTFLGAALATDAGRHIKVDVLTTWLPEVWIDRLYRPLNAGGLLVTGFWMHAAIRFWRYEWQYAPSHEQWLVLLKLIIPVGFGLLALHFLLATLLGPGPRVRPA
ncbi:TRAP transporter small permease [Thiohalobacter sp.]|uniref:TRAP transporter small permease n=1 Tax=Thiohalobacter sp. TaxID=2025948 RepID=UPI002635E4EC|nr:TRAP transporter small permease [Thiohalobacter sp.]